MRLLACPGREQLQRPMAIGAFCHPPMRPVTATKEIGVYEYV